MTKSILASDYDALPLRLLSDAGSSEAEEWLHRQDGVIRTLGEFTPEASRQLVEPFSKAGGQVFVVKVHRATRGAINGDETRESTGHLVVRLPTDATGRARVFRLEAKHAKSIGYDPTQDVGQKLLYIKLD